MRSILIERYVIEYCSICGKTPEMLGVDKLQLHESKYERPLNSNNFYFLCRGCNKLKLLRRELILGTSTITAEHEKNLMAKPYFKKWLFGEITKPENNFHLPYQQTLRQAAFECEVETVTIKRYLDSLIDFPNSPYVSAPNDFNQMHIWLRGHEPETEEIF